MYHRSVLQSWKWFCLSDTSANYRPLKLGQDMGVVTKAGAKAEARARAADLDQVKKMMT